MSVPRTIPCEECKGVAELDHVLEQVGYYVCACGWKGHALPTPRPLDRSTQQATPRELPAEDRER